MVISVIIILKHVVQCLLFSQLLRETSACYSNSRNVGMWILFTCNPAVFKSHPVLIFGSTLYTVILYYLRNPFFGNLLIMITSLSLHSACLVNVISFELRFRNRKQRVLSCPACVGPEGLLLKATSDRHSSPVTCHAAIHSPDSMLSLVHGRRRARRRQAGRKLSLAR